MQLRLGPSQQLQKGSSHLEVSADVAVQFVCLTLVEHLGYAVQQTVGISRS